MLKMPHLYLKISEDCVKVQAPLQVEKYRNGLFRWKMYQQDRKVGGGGGWTIPNLGLHKRSNYVIDISHLETSFSSKNEITAHFSETFLILAENF